MKKNDPLVALARQQKLAAAARQAVDGCLPQLTSVDLRLPKARPCKTNPISLPTAGQSAAPPRAARNPTPAAPPRITPNTPNPIPTPWEMRDTTSPARAPSPASRPPTPVDARLPQLTSVHPGLPNPPPRKTNPFPSEPPATVMALTPQQLAAARLLARGGRVAEVSASLRVTRQALWKWRRHPAFAAELRRLHELLARELRR